MLDARIKKVLTAKDQEQIVNNLDDDTKDLVILYLIDWRSKKYKINRMTASESYHRRKHDPEFQARLKEYQRKRYQLTRLKS